MRTIEDLIEVVRSEAEKEDFPVDRSVYESARMDYLQPVLYAGALESKICFFGRDLGKTEVAKGQPLIGAGGRLIRSGIYQRIHGSPPSDNDRHVESILSHVLLTNTVPYKPPGNKAYSESIKERFRPFVAELLTCHWKGNRVISLGTEAFEWFAPYADKSSFQLFWKDEARYEKELECRLTIEVAGKQHHKSIILAPLPHPSPLNRRWLPQIPALLQSRLQGFP